MEIRPAMTSDARAIARILAGGLGDKYGPAFGRHAMDALTAIVRASDGAPPGGYRVALDGDGTPCGVAFLGLDGAGAPVFGPISREVGAITAIRASVVLLAFAKGRVEPDEAHLDELAVSPDARRRGIGSALLAECCDAAESVGMRRISLWVTGDNTAARALYARAGFRVVQRRRWWIGRLLFGARGALLMERRLDGPPTPGAR